MAKFVAKGIVFEVETTTPGTYAAVPQVASIDLPEGDTEEVEVTTLDNTDDTREFLQGFKDGGECSLEMVFDPATHFTPADSVWKLYKSGAVRRWRVILPAAVDHRYKWQGYIRSAGLAGIQPGQALRLNATIRVSGEAVDFEVIP
jgi:hypothetical protein